MILPEGKCLEGKQQPKQMSHFFLNFKFYIWEGLLGCHLALNSRGWNLDFEIPQAKPLVRQGVARSTYPPSRSLNDLYLS